jgi:tetratricopeptide (TPR) repeat protein
MYLGVLEHNRERLDASIAWFTEALDAADAITPPNEPLIAEICLRFADTLSLAGEHDRARAIAARAAEIHEGLFPAGDPRLATVYAVGAITAARAGRTQDAVELGRRGLAVSVQLGDANPQTVNLLHETGRVLLDLDRSAEALALLDRAAVALRDGVEDPRRAALVDFDRARARWSTDPSSARTHARDALTGLPADAPAHEREEIDRWLQTH